MFSNTLEELDNQISNHTKLCRGIGRFLDIPSSDVTIFSIEKLEKNSLLCLQIYSHLPEEQ